MTQEDQINSISVSFTADSSDDEMSNALQKSVDAVSTSTLNIKQEAVSTPSSNRMHPSSNLHNIVKTEPNPERPALMSDDDLLDAIRNDKPYNEAERGALASQVCNMGRMAAHTGQRVMWDDALTAAPLAPDLEKLVGLDGAAPVKANADGSYPSPQPGITTSNITSLLTASGCAAANA